MDLLLNPSGGGLGAFTLSLCLLFVAERVVHACVVTLLYLFGAFGVGVSSSKGQAGLTLLHNVITSAVSIVTYTLGLVLQMISSLGQWVVTIGILIIVAGLLLLVYELSGHLLISISDAWNQGVGPTSQILVIWPLKLAALLLDAVLPIWNAFIWITKKVPSQLVVQTVTQDLGTFVAAVEQLARFFQASAASLVAWIGAFVCCDDGGVPAGACNPQCYDAGARVFDLITPMASLRRCAVYVTMWAKGMCTSLEAPIDMLTYPLMDINFAEGIHFLFNSALYTVSHLPALTAKRCQDLGAVSPVMCIPDFEPVFQMFVAGVRSIGLCLDNWLDVTVLIVESALGRSSPICTSTLTTYPWA